MGNDKIKVAAEQLAERARNEHSSEDAKNLAEAASHLAHAYATIRAVEGQFGKN